MFISGTLLSWGGEGLSVWHWVGASFEAHRSWPHSPNTRLKTFITSWAPHAFSSPFGSQQLRIPHHHATKKAPKEFPPKVACTLHRPQKARITNRQQRFHALHGIALKPIRKLWTLKLGFPLSSFLSQSFGWPLSATGSALYISIFSFLKSERSNLLLHKVRPPPKKPLSSWFQVYHRIPFILFHHLFLDVLASLDSKLSVGQ